MGLSPIAATAPLTPTNAYRPLQNLQTPAHLCQPLPSPEAPLSPKTPTYVLNTCWHLPTPAIPIWCNLEQVLEVKCVHEFASDIFAR